MQWPQRLSVATERAAAAPESPTEPTAGGPTATRDVASHVPPQEGLEPVRVLLGDADLAGWVAPHGERLTDVLQRRGSLAFLPAVAQAGEWVELSSRDLYAVVPPPHVSPPEFRVKRQRQQVLARFGRYAVIGIAHLRPGEEQDPLLRATRPFLPLTEATLTMDGDESSALHLDVIIVNLAHVEAFGPA
jgi:hypothetical protein